MRCRSDQNMAQILSKRPQQNSFQVVHFTSARRFDDGQEPNGDCFEQPALASRIQRNRHRRVEGLSAVIREILPLWLNDAARNVSADSRRS